MNRTNLFIICLLIQVVPGYSKQKITRVIQELDYKFYGKGIFQQITNDIYTFTIASKIKGYRDSTLKSEYSVEELKKRGSTSETVQFQEGANKGKDTTIYLSFDYGAATMWLEIQGDSKTIYSGGDLPIGLCYKNQGKRQVLFYISYADLKKSNKEDQDFLQQYLNSFPPENLNSGWQIIHPENIQKYVLTQFSWALSILKSAPYIHFKIYTSDSLCTELDSLALKKKKNYFSDYGQNLDTGASMGIAVVEEFNRETDTSTVINGFAIGICATIKLKGIQLYDVPLYYLKYHDAESIAMLSSTSFGQTVHFLRSVCDYQLLNRSSDNPLNSN